MKGWKFFVREVPWRGDKDLFIAHEDWQGRRHLLLPATMTALSPAIREEDKPFIGQTWEEHKDQVGDVDNFLQAALDAAWAMGLRPQGYKDRSDELASVRYHLEDMRTLALQPITAEAPRER